MKMPQSEFLDVPGGKIWAESFGNGTGVPLIVIHGGPGFPHDYLLGLKQLSATRPVIFYDQLGCGRSERPNDKNLWTVRRSVEELQILRDFLEVPEVHLLGHSWGAIPAAEYVETVAYGVRSLIFASPSLNIPRWSRDALSLREKLSSEHRSALTRGEAERDFHSSAYQAATEEYYRRFVYGTSEVSPVLQASIGSSSAEVYQTLWGLNEFFINGALRDYNFSPRLSKIVCPTLFTCGRQDESTPEACREMASKMEKAELHIYEKSAHLPHVTQQGEYIEELSSFLSQVDNGTWSRSAEGEKSIGRGSESGRQKASFFGNVLAWAKQLAPS